MGMKSYCYILLIVAFFVFYQQNPVVSVIILIIFVGIFGFFKLKKRSPHSSGLSLLSGGVSPQSSQTNSLITLMLLQQMMQSDTHFSEGDIDNTDKEHEDYIESIKKEILEIFGEQ